MTSRKNLAACSSGGATNYPSPTRSDKHQITPLKGKSKTLKQDRRSDVHTLCSTPDVRTSKLCNEFISPSNSLPFSQDSHPEVIWDYTSPKLPKGVSRKEINMTVDEFLKNMYHDQVPEYSKQASQYAQLLEKWMTTNETALQNKPQQRRRNYGKKNSRRIVEEMKQFLETIQIEKGNTGHEDSLSQRNVCSMIKSDDSNNTENLRGTSFLWGDDDLDSNDELWGDIFDSDVIVQATQELESCSVNSDSEKKFDSPSGTFVCTIPETVSPLSTVDSNCSSVPSSMLYHSKHIVNNIESNNNNVNNCDEETSSLGDLDWGKDFDESSDDWDDAFVIADESFSSIPDDVLQGVDLSQPPAITKSNNSDDRKSVTTIVQERDSKHDKNLILTFNETEVIFANGMSQIREYRQTDEVSCPSNSSHQSGNLRPLNCSKVQNSFEKFDIDDNSLDLFSEFNDDDILCKPEVLNLVDELESQLSQNQKCTPHEIRQKKYEALKRRQKSLRNKKPISRQKL